jgi:hypothetical protein
MDVDVRVWIGIVFALLILSLFLVRSLGGKLPGKLQPEGSVVVADVRDPQQMAERERDLGRSLAADNIQVRIMDEPCRSLADMLRDEGGAEKAKSGASMFDTETLSSAEAAGVSRVEALSALLERHSSLRGEELRLLRERVVNLLSVTPGFTFAMSHQVPPMFPQAKFLLQIASASPPGDIRVCWYAFVVDKPAPGMTKSEFSLLLASENLATVPPGRVQQRYVAQRTRRPRLEWSDVPRKHKVFSS